MVHYEHRTDWAPSPTAALCRALRRVTLDKSGVAAVEFAFVLPILALLLAGLIDFSRLSSQRMQVRAAAQSGANYVLRAGWDEAAVRQSITGSTSLSISADPAPRLVRGCLSAAEIVETTSETCPSGAKSGAYVIASARASFSPLMPWIGIGVPNMISASAFARVP